MILLVLLPPWISSSSFDLFHGPPCPPPSISSAILLVLLRAMLVSAVCSLITSPLVCSTSFVSILLRWRHFYLLATQHRMYFCLLLPNYLPIGHYFSRPCNDSPIPVLPILFLSPVFLPPLSLPHHPALSHYIPITFILLSSSLSPPPCQSNQENKWWQPCTSPSHRKKEEEEGGNSGRTWEFN